MSDTVTTLGAVGILPVGDWSNSSAYDRLNAVKYQGSMYVALKDVPAGVVPTNTTYWMLMAEKGESVQSVEKTGTSGLVDTYTMTMSSGRTFTFTVTNGEKGETGETGETGATGNGIQSIYKTGTSGLVDTYTILYTNGQTTEFEVTNGVASLSSDDPLMDGEAAAGTSDKASREDHVHPSDTSKANTDGYYQQMTVGNAEQLVSTVFIEDQTPYVFRTSGGSVDIGDREYDEVVGGTVAWNQMNKNDYGTSISKGITLTTNNDGSATITGTNDGTGSSYVYFMNQDANHPFIKDHVYYLSSGNYFNDKGVRVYASGGSGYAIPVGKNYSIRKATVNESISYVRATVPNNGAIDGTVTVIAQLFDFTQMFGSTIADYIYALETATPGAGVAWFKKLFSKDYYPYNAGTLLSVNASAHKLVGFNAYDHANTSAKVVGGNQYQITGTYTSLSLDGTAITPDSDGYFTPSVSGTLSVVGGNATDTCIHLVWDGERDGEYEPYEVYNYPLDSSLTLRGIPKLDAGNNLYYDGDTYESDGTVTRKYGTIVLDGTEAWVGGSVSYSYYIQLDAMKKASDYKQSILTLIGTSAYNSYNGGTEYGATGYSDKGNVYPNQNWLYLRVDGVTTKEGLIAWLSANPLTVIYELATSTTESADPFASPQIVNDFGTEEYVVTEQSGVAVPVGHVTKYANNLRAKLEMAPDSPPGDGEYIVKQTDGQNEYMQLAGSDTITAIMAKLPSAPSTDGTYVLTCTVSSGVATYTWEEQS